MSVEKNPVVSVLAAVFLCLTGCEGSSTASDAELVQRATDQIASRVRDSNPDLLPGAQEDISDAASDALTQLSGGAFDVRGITALRELVEKGDFVAAQALLSEQAVRPDLAAGERARAFEGVGALSVLHDRSAAAAAYTRALALDATSIDALRQLGQIQMVENDLDQAQATYQRLLEVATAEQDRANVAHAHANLGLIAVMAEPEGAEAGRRQLAQALAIDTELGRKAAMADHHSRLAYLNDSEGDPDAAIAEVLQAIELNQELDRKVGVAIAQLYLGKLYGDGVMFREGYHDKAVTALEAAVAAGEAAGARLTTAHAYDALGQLHYSAEEYPRAEAALQTAIELTQALGLDYPAAVQRVNLAGIYEILEKRDLARAALRESLATFEKLDSVAEAEQVKQTLERLDAEER